MLEELLLELELLELELLLELLLELELLEEEVESLLEELDGHGLSVPLPILKALPFGKQLSNI